VLSIGGFLFCAGIIGSRIRPPVNETTATSGSDERAEESKESETKIEPKSVSNEQQRQEEKNARKDGQAPSEEPKVQPPAPQEPPIMVDSYATLARAYRDNPVAAAQKYDGKRVRILYHVGIAEKMEKRAGTFWLMEDFGQKTIGANYNAPDPLAGARLVPVYAVEYQLSKEGEDQYAKLNYKERNDMDLIGTVKGTRPYAANTFGGTMLQVTECS
jgi:hypothetical protein